MSVPKLLLVDDETDIVYQNFVFADEHLSPVSKLICTEHNRYTAIFWYMILLFTQHISVCQFLMLADSTIKKSKHSNDLMVGQEIVGWRALTFTTTNCWFMLSGPYAGNIQRELIDCTHTSS